VSLRRARVGLTLVESVVAIFIICGCILVIMRMVSNGIDMNVRAEQVEQASLIASRQLETLREWAADPSHFYDSASWAAKIATSPFPDSDNPDYTVTWKATAVGITSPCTMTESRYSSPRVMSGSYMKVAVTVSWSPTSTRNQVVLTSLIGAAIDPVVSLTVTPSTSLASPQLVPKNSSISFTASGWDGTRNVPDLFFLWSQAPVTVNGSIGSFQNMTRTGVSGQYQNYYCDETIAGVPTAIYGPLGNVTLGVLGRSPAIYDVDSSSVPTHRWMTNTTGNVVVQNGP